ncbi:dihydrodipicolinate synthase family protein [Anaerocolumna sp.]|uniref:dihydrodipicolinate synthase family protein n=1 Tax=Anaerocolumna sp. TaxID=2041569 RepID=UPI0028ABD225|nr:dihydrodipicolinate synthase family protein [Anaerocolumna sp.]
MAGQEVTLDILKARQEEALNILKKGTFIPAHPLALTADRKLDEEKQRMLTRYYLASGAGGLAVAVHTTQFEIRDPKIGLFEPVLKIAVEEIEAFEKKTGKVIVRIAGVCGPLGQAVEEAKTALKLGYDAVLLSPGGLNNLSEEELLKRSEEVAKIIPVIGFYLQKSVGGRKLTFDYWQRFCEINNVVAIKAAPFNRYETLDVARAVAFSSRKDQIALYTGNDDNIVMDLLTKYKFSKDGKDYEISFAGGLLGHWSVWTHTAVKLFRRLKEAAKSEIIPAELLTLAMEVTDANAAFFDTANEFKGCIAGLHEVLRRQGILKGIWCLNEKETLSPGQAEEIQRVYEMYPHLNDDEFIEANKEKWM